MIVVHNVGLTGDTNRARVTEFICLVIVVPIALTG